jgi:hypothetical protein
MAPPQLSLTLVFDLFLAQRQHSRDLTHAMLVTALLIRAGLMCDQVRGPTAPRLNHQENGRTVGW